MNDLKFSFGFTAVVVLILALAFGSGASTFEGAKAGEEKEVGGIQLCWCPSGRFKMGSPHDEGGRRADQAQVEVTLTKGFWTGKFEVTQGQWKREMGAIPGKLIAGEANSSQQRNEFGVRLALGASPHGLLRLVLFQAGRLALVGLTIGVGVSFATNRLLASQLFGLSPHDPLLLGTVSLVVLLVALLASLLPALRAAKVHPMEALRHE